LSNNRAFSFGERPAVGKKSYLGISVMSYLTV